MATTKKGTTGTKAGAGARKNEAKAKVKAEPTKSKSKSTPTTKSRSKSTAATPAATKSQPEARGATAPGKAVPVKLNDRQREFLSRIKGTGESGYAIGPKAEQRTIDALVERKLVKKGARNKETGRQHYLLTRAGEKHLPEPMPATAPAPAPSPVSAAPSEPTAVAEPVAAPPA